MYLMSACFGIPSLPQKLHRFERHGSFSKRQFMTWCYHTTSSMKVAPHHLIYCHLKCNINLKKKSRPQTLILSTNTSKNYLTPLSVTPYWNPPPTPAFPTFNELNGLNVYRLVLKNPRFTHCWKVANGHLGQAGGPQLHNHQRKRKAGGCILLPS